jgi:hypothetical protein
VRLETNIRHSKCQESRATARLLFIENDSYPSSCFALDFSTMAFELQPLNAIADLEEIIQLMVVTLNTQEPMKTILGNASPEDKWTLLSHSIRDWLTKPGAVGLKMVESSTKYDSIGRGLNTYAYES